LEDHQTIHRWKSSNLQPQLQKRKLMISKISFHKFKEKLQPDFWKIWVLTKLLRNWYRFWYFRLSLITQIKIQWSWLKLRLIYCSRWLYQNHRLLYLSFTIKKDSQICFYLNISSMVSPNKFEKSFNSLLSKLQNM